MYCQTHPNTHTQERSRKYEIHETSLKKERFSHQGPCPEFAACPLISHALVPYAPWPSARDRSADREWMQLPARDLWAHVPGYESDEENDHPDCEAKIAGQARESLREVVKQLGDDWEELSVMYFKPPVYKTKSKDKAERAETRDVQNRIPSILTPSFRIEHTDAPVVRDTLLSNGMTATSGRDWLVQWSGPGLRDMAYHEMNEFQRVNHFPGSTELTRKDRLWMNFRDMAETFGSEAFDFVLCG